MIVGLTGKSCSGKNYVAKSLKALGFTVWDLDREAAKIRNSMKDEVLKQLGTYDARELRELVFQNPEKLHVLEKIIYPVLQKKILCYRYDLVINGATLHRSGFDTLCKFVIYVDAPYEERLKRAKKRDRITEKEFALREASQQDIDFRAVKYRCPVHVLDNTSGFTPEDLDRALTFRGLL